MFQLSNAEFIAGKCGVNNGVNCTFITQERIPSIYTEETTFTSTSVTPLTTSVSTLYTASDFIFIKNIILTNVTGSDIPSINLYINGTATADRFISDFVLKANSTLIIDDSGFSVYPEPVTTIVQIIGGGGGSANTVYGETPSGTIDGVNDTFTLVTTPITAKLRIYLNGQRLTDGIDFTFTGSTITMTTIPYPLDILRADYEY